MDEEQLSTLLSSHPSRDVASKDADAALGGHSARDKSNSRPGTDCREILSLTWTVNGERRTCRVTVNGCWLDPEEFRDLVPAQPVASDGRQLTETSSSREDGLSNVYALPRE